MTEQTETGDRVELTDEEWRAKLSPERYAVLRQKGTEPAWSGELLHVEGSGMFTCAGCGAALFPSDTKFESGSGWPSFYRALDDGVIEEHVDRTFGMAGPRSPVPGAVATSATSSPTVRPRPGSATA